MQEVEDKFCHIIIIIILFFGHAKFQQDNVFFFYINTKLTYTKLTTDSNISCFGVFKGKHHYVLFIFVDYIFSDLL